MEGAMTRTQAFAKVLTRCVLPTILACAPMARGQCVGYSITPGTGSIVPGTTDSGNHGDDVTTPLTLPFSWTLYGTQYTQVSVSSNGNIQFAASGNPGYVNDCLPSTAITAPTICAHWDDLMTNGTGGGIFTSVSGSAPNRIFNIEWRAVYFGTTTQLGFEVRLYEGQGRFDMVYGAVPSSGGSATVGVQSGAATPPTQFECNAGGISQGMMLTFNCTTSGSPVCSLGVNPASGSVGDSFVATCSVTPGVGPPSTGLAASLNATAVNGGTVALHDDGLPPDATAGDNIFSGAVTVGAGTSNGPKLLTSTVSDAQGRSSTCSTTFAVAGRPAVYEDLGTWTNPHNAARSYTLTPAEVHWYRLVLPAVANPAAWFDLYTGGSGVDTMLGLYDDTGTLKASDDDDGVGVSSALSFGTVSYPRNNLGGDAAVFDGRDGSLPAGTYWVALTSYPATFQQGWQVASSGGGGGPITLTMDLGSPVNPGGSGAANPSSVYSCNGATSLLTVTVTPGQGPPPSTGITVVGDLTSIGGSATQTYYNDGTHGDATAGDSIYSFLASIPGSVTSGTKTLPFTVADEQGRSSNGAITLMVSSCPVSGPDVYVNNLTDVGYFGNVGGATASGIYAYAVGTNACNAGDEPVNWIGGGNQHPVIAQNFYRFKGGRFEQVGQSWLKHGFASTNGPCPSCIQPPLGGQQLGVGCSDAYGSGLNGSQGNMGPRSPVNATTGAYPAAYTNPGGSVIAGRLQVHWPDVDPAANAGARYFAEGHYVTADDAMFVNTTPPHDIHGNGLNNATWREINMSNPAATSIPFVGNDHAMQPGIMAWPTLDASVVLANADYTDQNITARFIVGAKVVNNGNGTWTYEYAVYNHNSDRGGGRFSVPIPPGAVVTNIGFHDVDSHSGEPYDLTDWSASSGGGAVTWSTQTYAQNVNANAVRWGTMYNFRFTVNAAPNSAGSVTVGLFKPANANSPATSVSATVPAPTTPSCDSADFNCDGDVGTDADIESFFACLGGNCPAPPCTSSADFNHDGDVGTDADIESFFRVLAGGPC
jgi:hypothetical protein